MDLYRLRFCRLLALALQVSALVEVFWLGTKYAQLSRTVRLVGPKPLWDFFLLSARKLVTSELAVERLASSSWLASVPMGLNAVLTGRFGPCPV